MLKKRVSWAVVIISLILFAYVGCSGNASGGLSGTWEYNAGYGINLKWTFTGNRFTQEMMGVSTTVPYRVRGTSLVFENSGVEVSVDFEIENDTLKVNIGNFPGLSMLGFGQGLEFTRVNNN